MKEMIIKSKNIALKTTSSNDPELKEKFKDFEVLTNLSEKHIRPVETISEIPFRIEKNDSLIGEIKLHNIKWYNRKAEVSLILDKNYQNSGIGTEALQNIIEYAFNTMNLYRLEAEIIESNKPSKKLFEKMGFIYEGSLREAKYISGKYYDILRYGLLKREWEKKS